MPVYRGFIVWGAGLVVVLGSFLIFVAAGWPGAINGCVHPEKPTHDKPNTCYCEAFDIGEATRGESGTRQPVNTWVNLYALLTSFAVAWRVFLDRRRGEGPNLMQKDCLMADLYIFAVQFLGLGSMWFHASIKEWAGSFDQFSMFVYAAFLVFYTVRRLWDSPWVFWIGYLITVPVFTLIAYLARKSEYASLVLILILVAAYLIFEVILWFKQGTVMLGRCDTKVLWLASVVFIGVATLFWKLSQTGGPLCNPHSAFQPHGWIWHPFAGFMAVLLYFYWREENVPAR